MTEKKRWKKPAWIIISIILGIPILFFGLLFVLIEFFPMAFGEHGYSPEGSIYTMYNVEVLKNIELKPEKQEIVADFIAKKTSKRLSIKFHFYQLDLSNQPWRQKDPRVEKLYMLYQGTNIYLLNLTDKKVLYRETISEKNEPSICEPDTTMWLASLIETKQGNRYRIVVELPVQTESDSSFKKFKLVVGNVADASL